MRLSLLLFSLLNIISSGICSCQTKKLQTVYSSQQTDLPTELNEVQIYRLTKKAIHANFDMSKLNNFDEYRKDSISIREIFEPLSGEYNYYQFISTFKGLGMIFSGDDVKDSIKTFHDILIIKTNNENKIIDAFQYTLAWAEQPFRYDLYRSSVTDLPLTDGMDISTLKFTRTEFWDAKDKLLKESGIIKLK
ncbi:hypothetical protein [Dyadobacter sp. CY312]|uniref:hypothetical protein n=1 Tax=Dyadobacter sp. CY312 TaxID=2907303 RepID=UPI001F23C2F0|nr:hypothetical protein [Dyadobacter sp. CY312]MCE7042444.1 hypothetical protein [Dyadobacter sp. CY312]